MRLVHKWSDSDAKHVKALYGLRKSYDSKVKKKNPEAKTYRISKACSVDGCRAVVINLSRHLSGVHNIDSNSEEFEILKARAVRMEGPQSKRPKLEVGTQKTKNDSLTLVLNKELIESHSEDSSFEYYTQSSTSSSSSSSPSFLTSDSQSTLPKRGPETADFQKSLEEDDSPWRESSDGDYQDAGFSDDDLIAELASKTPKEEMRDIMDAFYNFLVSADSANKDPNAAQQCKERVIKILEVVDDEFDLQSLMNRKLVQDIFLKHYCRQKNLHPKTIQAYLTSLSHFCN